jgi:hypothetical protein
MIMQKGIKTTIQEFNLCSRIPRILSHTSKRMRTTDRETLTVTTPFHLLPKYRIS